jgi:hypothetical protein
MLKNIIEKRIDHLRNLFYKNEELSDYEVRKNEEIDIRINECQQLWLMLKKEAELQEEMAEALIFFINSACFECPKEEDNEGNEIKNCKDCNILKYIDLIEKYYNKKWEEIIKDGE